MKAETVKIKERIFYFVKSYPLKLVFVRFMCFIAGVITSRGSVFGGFYPFGISFSASIPGKLAFSTIIGALAGYLFPLNLSLGIRYISTLIAIAAVRWTLSDFTKIKNHFLYVPMIVFCSSLVTGLAVLSSEGFDLKDIFLSILESLVAAGAACLFEKTFKILSSKKINNLSVKEYAFVVLSLNIILFSISEISSFGVSFGRILAILIILVSAYVLEISGGCVAGIASGTVFGFSSFGFGNISMLYAFGGMIAGVFSGFGKAVISFSFLLSGIIVSFAAGDSVRVICCMYETLIAIVIYLFIPDSFLNRLKKKDFNFVGTEGDANLKQIIAQKLHFASKSVKSAPMYVEKAFWDVFKPENKNLKFKTGCVNAVYSTCKFCKKAPYCWGERAEITSDFFSSMIDEMHFNGKFYFENRAFEFCENRDKITESMRANYNKFIKQSDAKASIFKFKKSISEQMGAVSSVIEDFAESSCKKLFIKEDLSAMLIKELGKVGIEVLNLICYQNNNEKVFIDIECDSTFANKFSEKVIKMISEICGKNLCAPIINNYGATSRVQFCEVKKFNVDFGFTQHAFCGGAVCGDSFCKFEDGEGNFNVIISDGMGTGDKAAIQGNITSELMKNFVKSGIGAGSAVRFVNSALLLNGSEETLSTLDMISLNLFDGKAKFAKAGAPPTLIIRNEEIIKIGGESLPIGILSDAEVLFEDVELKNGDFVVMFSDGVTDIGGDWIYDIIKSKNYENAKELSKRIVKKAIEIRKKNNHDDDITCIAINLAC